MAILAAALPYIAGAATVVSTAGAIQQGVDARHQADEQTIALRNQANADQAAAERTAINSRRQTAYVVSRGQALAAASGAGATDPTVMSVLGQISGEGEYHALTSLYEGGTQGQNLNSQATAASSEGKAYQRAGYLKGISTLLTGGTTLATKYG